MRFHDATQKHLGHLYKKLRHEGIFVNLNLSVTFLGPLHKIPNYGLITKFHVYMKVSGQKASILKFLITKNSNKKDTQNSLKILHVFVTLNKKANYGWISKFKVCMEAVLI